MKLRRSTLRLLAGALVVGPALSLTAHAEDNTSETSQQQSALFPLETSREVVGDLEFRPKSLFEQLENLLDDDPAPKPPADLFKRAEPVSESPAPEKTTKPLSSAKEPENDSVMPVESSDMEMRGEAEDEPGRVAAAQDRTPFDDPSVKTTKSDIPTTLAPPESDIVVAPAPAFSDDSRTPSTQDIQTPELEEIQLRIDLCLAQQYMNPENPATRSSWGIMHSMLSYGADTRLIANGDATMQSDGSATTSLAAAKR